jgi:hypothetical protein
LQRFAVAAAQSNPSEEYEEMLEDLEDLAVAAERRDSPTQSHDEVITELKRDGLLPD